MNNQDSTSPRYMEVTSDGKILRQSDTIPSDVQVSYLNSQGSTNNYNSTYSNAHWSNYPYQTSNNKNRWPNNGQFNPYRTTYQDYGPNNHKTLVPNVLYTRADLYRQVSNLNNGNSDSLHHSYS